MERAFFPQVKARWGRERPNGSPQGRACQVTQEPYEHRQNREVSPFPKQTAKSADSP